MQLTVYVERPNRPELAFSLDVGSDLDLENLKALCEAESGIPSQEMQLFHGERMIEGGSSTLVQFGLRDGDMVVLKQSRTPAGLSTRRALTQSTAELPNIDFGSINVPSTSRGTRLAQRNQSASRPHAPAEPISTQAQSPTITSRGSSVHSPSRELVEDPVALRETLLASPHDLALLRERNPPLADALLSGDLEKFSTVLREQGAERAKRQAERIRLFNSDPFDIDAQARIAEDIRQQNVEENMTMAMEEAPESFGQVVMLYINCTVNGHPVQAFVDSGAQMTIMSQAAAERCNIMRLVDRRWAGIAKGVGTQRIIGRVHLGQIQIERDFLPSSFSILEEQPMDMLLGLDMLKRHQCVIDLRRNVLVIGTTGTETRFLTESELPECARLALVGGSDPRSLSGGYSPSPVPAQATPSVTEVEDRDLAEALQQSAYESKLKIAIPPISNLPQEPISPSAAHHHISPPQPHAHDVRTPGNSAGEQASGLETLTAVSPSEVELVGTVRSAKVDFGVQASNQPVGVSENSDLGDRRFTEDSTMHFSREIHNTTCSEENGQVQVTQEGVTLKEKGNDKKWYFEEETVVKECDASGRSTNSLTERATDVKWGISKEEYGCKAHAMASAAPSKVAAVSAAPGEVAASATAGEVAASTAAGEVVASAAAGEVAVVSAPGEAVASVAPIEEATSASAAPVEAALSASAAPVEAASSASAAPVEAASSASAAPVEAASSVSAAPGEVTAAAASAAPGAVASAAPGEAAALASAAPGEVAAAASDAPGEAVASAAPGEAVVASAAPGEVVAAAVDPDEMAASAAPGEVVAVAVAPDKATTSVAPGEVVAESAAFGEVVVSATPGKAAVLAAPGEAAVLAAPGEAAVTAEAGTAPAITTDASAVEMLKSSSEGYCFRITSRSTDHSQAQEICLPIERKRRRFQEPYDVPSRNSHSAIVTEGSRLKQSKGSKERLFVLSSQSQVSTGSGQCFGSGGDFECSPFQSQQMETQSDFSVEPPHGPSLNCQAFKDLSLNTDENITDVVLAPRLSPETSMSISLEPLWRSECCEILDVSKPKSDLEVSGGDGGKQALNPSFDSAGHSSIPRSSAYSCNSDFSLGENSCLVTELRRAAVQTALEED